MISFGDAAAKALGGLTVETSEPDHITALRELVEFLEEHRAYCKRTGERPIIDAHRVRLARSALNAVLKERGE